MANKEVDDWFGEQIKEKSKGRNHDLSVAEYKVAQETKHLTQLQKQVEESDRAVKANKAVEKEYTDKKEKLETDISYLESMRRITESLSEMDSRESKHISKELDEKRTELQSVNEELASAIEKAEDATKLLDRVKSFVSSFRLFAPTIEEYDNQVEADKTIEAGNSFHGILNELGKLLEAFKELIKEGVITEQQAKIGYVAAYPYAEVISGYTAFLLGVRSVVPEAVMTVRYTNKWNDYRTEKKYAKDLIDEGCVIISQHSDTAGPATACEETAAGIPVYLVSYNQSMEDVAPTTYLTGCKINWEPYMMGAVDAVLNDRVIEKSIKGTVNGNDIGAGFEEGWVQMLELNEITAADGTVEKMQKVIRQFEQGKLDVFRGDYVGADPDDPDDTYDLNQGYTENEFASAPSSHYVLKDVIRIEE